MKVLDILLGIGALIQSVVAQQGFLEQLPSCAVSISQELNQ